MSRKTLAVAAAGLGAVLLAACSPPEEEATAGAFPGADTAAANAAAVEQGQTPAPAGSTQGGAAGYTNPSPTQPSDGAESDLREGGGTP